MMAPTYAADPLKFNFDEDPQLRHMFGTTQPLESSGPLESGETGEAAAAPSVSPIATPSGSPAAVTGAPVSAAPNGLPATSPTELPSAAPSEPSAVAPGEVPSGSPSTPIAAPSEPTAEPSEAPAEVPSEQATPEPSASPDSLQTPIIKRLPMSVTTPISLLQRWFLEIPEAYAADSANPMVSQILSLGAKLKRVVVNDGNASGYRANVDRLLDLSGQRQLADGGIDAAQRQVYMTLVKSAAWQESCWRQFINRDGSVHWLESSTGDIGLMQVNKHVWRGFYNVQRLRWDVVYNVGAGDEILMQMMRHAAEKGAGKNQPAELARSAYSSYNGGPGAWDRWRRSNVPADQRLIDRLFWQKYQVMANGQSFDIMKCAAEWGHPHAD